ncbi:ferredoxin reductase family protein [Calidifontibacter terrae]
MTLMPPAIRLPDTAVRPPRSIARPWWRDAAGALTWASLLFVVALWLSHGGIGQFGSWTEGWTSIGRLSGLIASDLLLIQVLLMARIPFVEKSYGQDELARRHRLLGFSSFTLLWVHVVTILAGYASARWSQLWSTAVDLTLNYPAMLLAEAGTIALCLVVVTSIRAARRRLRYESWHLLHLYAYLGAGLALPHQLWTGQDFTASTAATVFWWSLWACTALAVVVFRLGLPLRTALTHDLRVASVERLTGDVVTVTVTGRALHRLQVSPGQFFQWRFAGQGRSRANPYSLSHAPDGRSLRITVAEVGGGSARLATLQPGTKVWIEGPYGRLHEGVRTRRKVLLIGAGIGITPLRALYESLQSEPGDITLIQRASSAEQVLWADDLERIAAHRGHRLAFVTGPRAHRSGKGPGSWLPQNAAHLSDLEALLHLVPDVRDHDVFVCGGEAWMTALERTLLDAGVSPQQIHIERFSY